MLFVFCTQFVKLKPGVLAYTSDRLKFSGTVRDSNLIDFIEEKEFPRRGHFWSSLIYCVSSRDHSECGCLLDL